MKKLLAMLLALSLTVCLCACGTAEPEAGSAPTGTQPAADTAPAETTAPITEPAGADYSFPYNGVKIAMNAPAEDIIISLGEPNSYTEETSCAFDGLDKTYYYGPFYLQTYPLDGADYIYCLWIVDDSVETPEGIYIGATQAQVEAAYGTEGYNGSNAYVLTGTNARLTIILENGVVSSIQYDAVL